LTERLFFTQTSFSLTDTSLYPHSDIEIKQWLSQVSKGDEKAFSNLLRIFWNKVYTQALTYLKSSMIAQELTQDIFLKIWINRQKLEEVDNFHGYLFIMTKNEIISRLRKKTSQTIPPDEKLKEEIWIPDLQLQNKQVHTLVLQAIEMLPPARKNIFKLSRLDGLTYDEIANQMNISRNGVKDHIVKALLFLRNFIRFHSDIISVFFFLIASDNGKQ
jgi:RNA polymerase sigma-70 factor (ECF subfamily)